MSYFVLTQRTAQRIAGSRKRRLAARYGAPLSVDGTAHVAFPSLDRLTELGPDQLAEYTGNPRQTDYFAAAARGLARLDEEWLYTAPYEEVRAALRGIRGIGEFTASAILLRVLGRPDHVPVEMAQFADVISTLYGPGTPVDAVRARYGPQVGWWSYFAKTALGWRGVPVSAGTGKRNVA